ncbi:MAG: hypothetical protein A2Y33_07155 [Spirochaetes bacterium GWF1_51_8]|nr:MAG: hypothetical protein A2Y33_07155 [Spirochaetes bacterium GWF1_51_8]
MLWSTNITLSVFGPVTNSVYAVNTDGASSLTQYVVLERVSIPGIAITSPGNYLSTKDPNLTIFGTAAIDAPYSITAVQVKLNGGTWNTATGTAQWSNSVVLQEGLNFVSARVIGSSGKTNTVDDWQITLDSTLPDVFIQFPAEGTYTNNPSVTVSGIASNQAPFTISKVQVKLNLGGWTDAVGTASWSKALTLVEGTNSISVRAISTANKTNSLNDWKVYLDTTKPSLLVVTPLADIAIVSNHYRLSGTASDLTGVEGVYVSVNAGAFKKLSGTTGWNTNLINMVWESTYTIKIFAKDVWGYYSLTNTKIIYMKNKIQAATISGNSDHFGIDAAVSADGKTVYIGARDYGSGDWGVTYVEQLGAVSWAETAKAASDFLTDDRLGWAVAITPDGISALTGSFGDDNPGNDQGSVYLFKWNGSSWGQTKISASDGAAYDNFGFSVDISSNGNSIAVGAIFDDVSVNADQGSVYVFKWTSSWVQTHLIASDGAANDFLGHCIAISGDGNTIVSGARGDDISGKADQGSISIFRYNGSGWDETKKYASDGAAGDQFGSSVDISYDGNSIIVGAPTDDSIGSAYVFKYSAGIWSQTSKITPSDGASGDQFGYTIAISANGNAAIVGAYLDDIAANADQGSAYVYEWNGSSWPETKYTAPDGLANDHFGYSVDVNQKGTIAVVGAVDDDLPIYTDRGSAWIFSID